MALVYFDSSALVKLLVDEEGSDLAAQLWDTSDAPLSSRLAYPEVCAALAAAGRNHDLTPTEVRVALSEWRAVWTATRPVELTADVEQRSGELAERHALRGADAVHLASMLAIGSSDLVVAVWDRRLHAAVVAERLAVTPATIEP